MKEIYLVRKESKNNKGVFYSNLYIDLGYEEKSISMDLGVISALLNLTQEEIATMKVDEKKLVATFNRVSDKKEGK